MTVGAGLATIHHRQVAATLEATRVRSATTFSWFGIPSAPLPTELRRRLSGDAARAHLVSLLGDHLYLHVYCQGGPRAHLPGPSPHPPSYGGLAFVEALAAANAGIGHWESRWAVNEVADAEVVATRDGLRIRASAASCRPAGTGPLQTGVEASVWFPNAAPAASPGFYAALSDAPFAPTSTDTVARLYWNLLPDAAIALMRTVTRTLNARGLAFVLKVRADPAGFNRCDAGVLYVRLADLEHALDLLSPTYLDLAPGLREPVPAFTRRLAAGVALALDPGRRTSFGEHRSELLAEGIVRCHEHRHRSLARRIAAIEESLLAAGIELAQPFRTVDQPTVDTTFPSRHSSVRRTGSSLSSGGPLPDEWHEIASGIADRLCREAIWHRRRCNWLGVTAGAHPPGQTTTSVRVTALGADLYAGTSGIALFLAEVAHRTGSRRVRATAHAAMARSLERAMSDQAEMTPGLYTGCVGIALAAARVGILISEPSFLDDAFQLAKVVTDEPRHDAGYDLLGGLAGTIVGLLVLHELLGGDHFVDRAVRYGDLLVQASTPRPQGTSWPSGHAATAPHLTGLSHGASGIGYALNELHAAAPAMSFADAADDAFAYESSLYDPSARNWPDLREGRGAGAEASAIRHDLVPRRPRNRRCSPTGGGPTQRRSM